MKAGSHLLIVEDNLGDARLYSKVFSKISPRTELHLVADGDAALAFLRRTSPYEAAPRPDLVLLDLNLPRRDGRELLAEVKADADLLTIPIIVITSSDADNDIANSYELRANCFLTKPLNLDELLQTLESAATFWLTVARLPARR
jgi:CheY-like chemotaxis protein